MRISFAPQRRDDALNLSKTGDVLSINGEAFDFSNIPDGASLPSGAVPCDWIMSNSYIERVGGELQLTLVLPIGPNPSQTIAFPQPITVTADGPIAVPADSVPEEDHVDA
jgi:hypothetical protein